MTGRKKEAGNVGEILTIGLCILALTALMISYMENVQLIAKKAEVGQLARCYLLKMETVGYLAAQDQMQLTAELENLGMTGIDYEGSTLNPAGYGNDVVLQIHGRLGETYEIYEKEYLQRKTREQGQVSWVLGLFLILFWQYCYVCSCRLLCTENLPCIWKMPWHCRIWPRRSSISKNTALRKKYS